MRIKSKALQKAATSPASTAADIPPYPKPDASSSHRQMVTSAAILSLVYFICAQPLGQSPSASRSLWALSAAFATEKSAVIDHFLGDSLLTDPHDFPNLAYFQGHYYSDSAPGAAMLSAPFYQLGRIFGDPDAWGIAFNSLLGGLAVLLVYATSRKLGSAEISARFAGVAFGLGTLVWREAGQFSPFMLSLVLLTGALWLVFPPLPRSQAHGRQERFGLPYGLLLGFTLGFAVVVDYPNVVWIPFFLVYILWRKRVLLTGWAGLGLGLLLGVLPLALYNWLILGKPWAFTFGFLLGDTDLASVWGQYLYGPGFSESWSAFFGAGRTSLGLFALFFGTWGLTALWGQRGKRRETLLLVALIVAIIVAGLIRRPAGFGFVMADFVAPVLVPFAVGMAVWHERLLFLTRLEYRGLPALSTIGLAFYYLISPPGPGLPNLAGLLSIWPLVLIIATGLTIYHWQPRPSFAQSTNLKRAVILAVTLVLLVPLVLLGANRPAFASGGGNNLLYNPSLKAENGKINGWYGLKPNQSEANGLRLLGNNHFLPYLTPVQGGKVYGLNLMATSRLPGILRVNWIWSDEGHDTIDSFSHDIRLEGTQPLTDKRAAPPGAAYLQLVFDQIAADTVYKDIALYDDGVRVEPMKNYATAALAFSFDWESAMGGLIHSRGGGTSSLGESGGDALTENNFPAVVAYANERGMAMRAGADNLIQLFQKYNIKGTFYATGYNLLDGNTEHRGFSGNPTYKWAKPPYWPNDYWTNHGWFASDPFGTYQTNPAWYFGDQTDRLKAAGQEVASHTFGHILVRAASTQDLTADIAEWLNAAVARKLPPARSFAFPWKGSNSLTPAYYDVLFNAGFRFITRTYDRDQGYDYDSSGAIRFLSAERDQQGNPLLLTEAEPTNYYYYLDRIHYALRSPKTGRTERTTDPRLLSLHDFQLMTTAVSERDAKNLIDELARRRGSYGSIWTHPEAVAEPTDVATWERVIAYADQDRQKGVWVDGVEAIMQYRVDCQQVRVKTEYQNGGKSLKITLTNPTKNALDGLTLTLPAPVKSANGAASFKGAQLVVPTLAAGGNLTLTVELDQQ